MLLERVQTTFSANKNLDVLRPDPLAQVIDNDHGRRQAGYAMDVKSQMSYPQSVATSDPLSLIGLP